jgi:hypothetical protein
MLRQKYRVCKLVLTQVKHENAATVLPKTLGGSKAYVFTFNMISWAHIWRNIQSWIIFSSQETALLRIEVPVRIDNRDRGELHHCDTPVTSTAPHSLSPSILSLVTEGKKDNEMPVQLAEMEA